MKKAALAICLAVVLGLSLAGCHRTITVTDKYRSWVGIYWVCDGSGSLFGHKLNPCRKGHMWSVPRNIYNKAVVGKTYTI